MENSQDSSSPSTSLLQCEENEIGLDEEDDHEVNELGSNVHGGNDDEYIRLLHVKEIPIDELQLKIEEFSRKSADDWIQQARSDGIQYILRKRVAFGFHPKTAYLAVYYLTRVLSTKQIYEKHSWAIRLLSVASLSLAAKMEETEVHALSEFCSENYNFRSADIQRMELMVLRELNWEMGPVTPFAFTRFFAEKLRQNLQLELEISPSRIEQLILGTMASDKNADVNTLCYKPSVLAAAATLVAIEQRLTRNALRLKITPLATEFALNIEDVISCYFRVQETVIEPPNRTSGRRCISVSTITSARGKTTRMNYTYYK